MPEARRLVIAAPHSGSGKTTVTCLLALAWRHQGRRIQPFKLGPDYLDPTHLSRAAGQTTRNLDSFLLPPERLRELFARASAQADLALIEGVMGLYDGRDPRSDQHSSADLARALDAPVVLVIDASGMARTVAAVAAGLRDFGRREGASLKVAGVILNRVGSVKHAALCEEALEQMALPVFGFVLRDQALDLPARHLGLISAEQASWDEERALEAAQHLRLDALWHASQASPWPVRAVSETDKPLVRLAYALDEAFHFYYPDALDELRLAGAELVPFSPLRDQTLPVGSRGLLLGGGYPEVHAQQLSQNTALHAEIRRFAAAGHPVIAECGGLMYLAQTLRDLSGQEHPMCGVIPYHTRMCERLTLGYREATAVQDTPLSPSGAQLRGHEFHFSVLTHEPSAPAYR